MTIVFNYFFPECTLSKVAVCEKLRSLSQRLGHAGKIGRAIEVAREALWWFHLFCNPVQTRGQHRGKAEIRIAIRPGDSAFYAKALLVPHHPETGSAIIVAPRDAGGAHEPST